MQSLSYSSVQKRFIEMMDRVCDSHEAVIITRENARPVVVMSLEDYNAKIAAILDSKG